MNASFFDYYNIMLYTSTSSADKPNKTSIIIHPQSSFLIIIIINIIVIVKVNVF